MITATASETYAWLQGRAPWYRPTRGDLCLVAWWAESLRPPPPLVVSR